MMQKRRTLAPESLITRFMAANGLSDNFPCGVVKQPLYTAVICTLDSCCSPKPRTAFGWGALHQLDAATGAGGAPVILNLGDAVSSIKY